AERLGDADRVRSAAAKNVVRQRAACSEPVRSAQDRLRLVVATTQAEQEALRGLEAVLFEKRELAELFALLDRLPNVLTPDVAERHGAMLSGYLNIGEIKRGVVFDPRVQNGYKRAMGRPRLFDEDAAVERALQMFWTRGYGATTPVELLDAIGVGKG